MDALERLKLSCRPFRESIEDCDKETVMLLTKGFTAQSALKPAGHLCKLGTPHKHFPLELAS